MQNNINADSMEQRARDEIDRCDGEIGRKERLIVEKQKFIEVLEREIIDLKKHRASLEFIISGTRPAFAAPPDENQERLPFVRSPAKYHNNTTRSLTGSVADIIYEGGNGGLTVADISDKLKAKGFNNTTSNFYQVVYSACVRLTRSPNSDIRRKEDAKGILFYAEKNPA